MRSIAMWMLVLMIGSFGAAEAGGLKGKLRKGVYESPAANFVVPLPGGVGMRANDWYDKKDGLGSVAFHDDFGNNLSIFYMQLGQAGQAASFPSDSAEFGMLASWLREIATPTWFNRKGSQVSPQVRGEFAGKTAAFAVVDLPGGSTLANIQGDHFDSRRGVAIVFQANYIYMVATELLSIADLTKGTVEAYDGKDLSFVPGLQDFFGTIKFAD